MTVSTRGLRQKLLYFPFDNTHESLFGSKNFADLNKYNELNN